jgi:hypothetical protein
MRLAVCTFLVLSACLPPLSSVEGTSCDEARPCPDALFCLEGVCRADGTRPEVRLVFADDCESAGTSPWVAVNGALREPGLAALVAGSRACRLSAGEMPAATYSLNASLGVRRGTYCVEGSWGQSTTPSPARFFLRRFSDLSASTLVEERASSPLLADAGISARRTSTSIAVDDESQTAAVQLVLSVDWRARAAIYFDEVVVRHAEPGADAGCSSP